MQGTVEDGRATHFAGLDDTMREAGLQDLVDESVGGQAGPDQREVLRSLFAEVLNLPQVGLDDSFLDLGGQSVTAMLLMSQVNTALGTDLSIADLFDSPTVSELAALIRERSGAPADSPAAGSGAESGSASGDSGIPANAYALSFNQEFFCDLDMGESAGSFSAMHTLVQAWRLTGAVDDQALRYALDDLVERHEILRSEVARDAQPRYQEVRPPSPVKLLTRTIPAEPGKSRDLQCEELLAEVALRDFSAHDLPLLRADLGRFDDTDSVLLITAHHSAVDAWSMQVVIRDLATLYAIRRGLDAPALPEMGQYREYAASQHNADASALDPERDFWREKLSGARAFALPIRPAEQPESASRYAMRNISLSPETSRAIVRMASELRCSPYMVMLSAFYLMAHGISGATDLTVTTFSSGRSEARYRNTIGPFLNLLPVRTEISGSATFRELVKRTRANCVEAYSHDIPFAQVASEAPELFEPPAPEGYTMPTFEMIQSPNPTEGEVIGDVGYTEVHIRHLFEGDCPDIPDGMLWLFALLSPEQIVGSIQFKRSEFSSRAITDLMSEFTRILGRSLAAPDDKLDLLLQ